MQATRVEAVQPIPSTELPDPPPDLQQIIERGNVRWLTGGPPRETPDSFPASLSLAGETRFKFRYRYDSHARWSYERPSAGQPPTVLLRIRFRSVKLHVSHEVWLKHVPAAEKFWEDPLVRHECDHVRISSMPAIEQQFLDSVKAMKTVHVPLADVAGTDGRVSDREVQRWIDRRMDEALERTTDYVRIRYRELDRLTQHGRLPIPEDRGLIEISPGAPLNR
ncbi:hypothetical protein FYK55_10795 [Roseiconus nitratireducens]|uniref:Uncharacterized protein n=1 Tax=Roseiconus nitratireducens TaxID=2605748 RepID=A0A5M6D823_9BACT|nr:hypothetical protein [Roseiconus nitratireducens]KAA5543681.1 hypothetical protein FYK55_10795 [Roseiconus nitratireducens]